jgi:hypothetical protein
MVNPFPARRRQNLVTILKGGQSPFPLRDIQVEQQ